MTSYNQYADRQSLDGNKHAALKDVRNLMITKRLANLGFYGLLMASSVYAIEQATEAKPIPAILELAAVDALFVYGGAAINNILSDRAEDRVERFSRARTGRIMKSITCEEDLELKDCDAGKMPGKQRVGIKTIIGTLAAPTAFASHNIGVQLVTGAVTAICALEVIADGPMTQIMIGNEGRAMTDQILMHG